MSPSWMGTHFGSLLPTTLRSRGKVGLVSRRLNDQVGVRKWCYHHAQELLLLKDTFAGTIPFFQVQLIQISFKQLFTVSLAAIILQIMQLQFCKQMGMHHVTYRKHRNNKTSCWQKAVEGLFFNEKLLNLRHRPFRDLDFDAKRYITCTRAPSQHRIMDVMPMMQTFIAEIPRRRNLAASILARFGNGGGINSAEMDLGT